jgi:hypothetical protein
MFKSVGKLVYSPKRCVVEVDDDIARFYRALIPKSKKWLKPMYATHITVVRTGIESVDPSLWGYMDGVEIPFTYDPYIWIARKYIWLDAFSSELEGIRENLGLPRHRMPHPLGMDVSCFHITIANMKF